MILSIWRYSHLTLAITSFVFILTAAVTGVILAFEPISERLHPYATVDLDEVTLAEALGTFEKQYQEIIELEIDHNQFVLASVITTENKNLVGYFDPITGEFLGEKLQQSILFQFATNLHRSLFLKKTGRFLVGISSALLFLIALSGSILVIKRQGGITKILSTVVDENWRQYYHVVLGRLSLIPIIIITISGVYLSLLRFNIVEKDKRIHETQLADASVSHSLKSEDFKLFNEITLNELKSVEFPFSKDVEDYYQLILNDRELMVNQFTGEVVSEAKFSVNYFLSKYAVQLHTGKGSVWWSLILMIASANILFFIYSGFQMTFKRRKSQLKNKYDYKESKFVILIGSENGNTVRYANKLYQELLKLGQAVYIAQLNHYQLFEKCEQLIIMTSTYGKGEAPSNANQFLRLVKEVHQKRPVHFSVVGFGSHAYPQFCQFADEVEQVLLNSTMNQLLPLFKIHDQSIESLNKWVNSWSEKVGLEMVDLYDSFEKKPPKTKQFRVLEKNTVNTAFETTFILRLDPIHFSRSYTSGDLLAIYPKNDNRERLYSIGMIGDVVQLSIKLHEKGLGSNFLSDLKPGEIIDARIISNTQFHFPKKSSRVILIANGTGIAPFLGMLNENTKGIETYLYFGLKDSSSFEIYEPSLQKNLDENNLKQLQLAFSQQEEKIHVQDLLQRDADFIAETFQNKGIVMICGSLSMQKEVQMILHSIVSHQLNIPLSQFEKAGQLKKDCY